jgi:protein ImuB
LAATKDSGFGFEAVGLAVSRAEPLPARQMEFRSATEDGDRTERCAALIDTLRQRLGPYSVRRFEARESHVPERAELLVPATGAASAWPVPEQQTEKIRPLLLLPRAEPAEVTALVPEGPPRRFSWRGATYDITGAEGPERIDAEWWRQRKTSPTRDYYLVEDSAGRRFWLYREGLYDHETAAPLWFVHGLFA